MFKTNFTDEELIQAVADDAIFQLGTYGYQVDKDEDGFITCRNKDDYYPAIAINIIAGLISSANTHVEE